MTWEEQTTRTARGFPRTEIVIKHQSLGTVRVVRDASRYIAVEKASAQIRTWDAKWRGRHYVLESEEGALQQTQEAQSALHELESVLRDSLTASPGIEWSLLSSPFAEPEPKGPARMHDPPRPEPPKDPGSEPDPDSDEYLPEWRASSFVDALVPRRWRKRLEEAHQLLERDHADWEAAATVHASYPARLKQWEKEKEYLRQHYDELDAKWKAEIAAWRERKQRHEADEGVRVTCFQKAVAAGERAAVEECFTLVLEGSEYPDCFAHEFELAFNPDTRILICDHRLPSPDALPTLKEVTFVKSKAALTKKHLSKRESEALYDSVVYQTCLRTVNELFSADEFGVLDLVTFNGWVEDVDRATGKDVRSCILSLQASRKEFESIDLARADPRECFRGLKGVGSSKLHALAAVAPLLQLNKEDDRFIEGREVVAGMEQGTNLAAMDWEDFEHLIRELFEEEFAERGGQVKITQASRDRGVDAVVFDPDPISGGKIILQAKRYTNTVGVEAVRDLYGTVINEGANKGILVTTSDYGPDAYQFARDKPITLLNGGNLLHLLGKHGHRARIDLREAKMQLSDETPRRA